MHEYDIEILDSQIHDHVILSTYDDDENNSGIAEMLKMCTIYSELSFDNEAILEIGKDIIQGCYRQGKNDVIVSKTGDGEMLLYRKTERGFSNIIIDENADVEYLFIDNDRQNSFNEYHTFIMGINADALVSKM